MITPTAPWATVGAQSVLDPAGGHAAEVAQLSWSMFLAGGAILALTMGLLGYALLAPPRRRRWLAGRAAILVGGLVLPVLALTALLAHGLVLMRTLGASSETSELQIHVVGEQFWWRVRYEEAAGRAAIATANEIHVPVGRPVRFTLTTADVIHSFWVPALGGKLDMIPGQVNSLVLKADRPGVYRGQCTEFCGAAHALMAFSVVAHEPSDFDAWLADQAAPAREPEDPLATGGRKLFLAAGCGACHTVRGTAESGRIGPDLTHVGSRRFIAAGTFPNNRGTLAGWIVSSQHLKPKNKMPSFNIFTGEELSAIAAYLESLK